MLFDLAQGHYWLVYRGSHVLLLAAALFRFVRALDIRTWRDGAAGAFALTVFTGIHTFRGLVREGFPVNHFLVIVVYSLLALNLARSKGGWWVYVTAVVVFVAASLTLDTGLPEERVAASLVRHLRQDAIDAPVTNPYLLPRWFDRWWGE